MSAIRTDDRLEFVEYRQRTKDFIPLYEPVVTEEMRQAVLRGYDEQLWIRGSRTWESQGKEFEEEVCKFIGCNYAVNMTSGTAALLLALKAFEIGPGDEVITVPNTFPAPTDVIMWAGATPASLWLNHDGRLRWRPSLRIEEPAAVDRPRLVFRRPHHPRQPVVQSADAEPASDALQAASS